MKTNPSVRILSLATFAPLAVATAAVLLTQPISAVPVTNDIQIVENSSTSLTATYNDSPVTVQNIGPDNWTLTFPSSVVFFFDTAWTENENAALVNLFHSVALGNPGPVDVFSDLSQSQSIPYPDGTVVTGVGFDTSNQGLISVVFNDCGDVPVTAPETGSPLGLLFLALTGLFGAKRLRSFRLA